MSNNSAYRRSRRQRRLFLIGIHAALLFGALAAAFMRMPLMGMSGYYWASLDIYRDESERLLVSAEPQPFQSRGELFYSSTAGQHFRQYFAPVFTRFQGALKVFPNGDAFSPAEMAAFRLLVANAYEQDASGITQRVTDDLNHDYPGIELDLPRLLRSGEDRITAVFWPGVLYNICKALSLIATAYCLAVVGVLTGREIRDRRRRRPGACAGCGYELGGPFARCPECGREVDR